MSMSMKLRSKVAALIAAGGGALAIAVALLGGPDGVEGRMYVPYQDVVGVWTVCDGHTGADIINGRRYSDAECDALLASDLAPVKKSVDAAVTVPLSEPMRASLYSFTYNVGVTAFRNSTLLRKMNAGDRAGACEELKRWTYAGGKQWKGLMNRRAVENEVCTWGGVNVH